MTNAKRLLKLVASCVRQWTCASCHGLFCWNFNTRSDILSSYIVMSLGHEYSAFYADLCSRNWTLIHFANPKGRLVDIPPCS